MEIKSIETERLLLREFHINDSRIISNIADKYIADTMLDIPVPYTEKMVKDWIVNSKKKLNCNEYIHYAIILKDTKELIGNIELSVIKEHNLAELGFWIAKKYWNKGITTEASNELLEYGFTILNLNKIYATHFKKNKASGKVLQKIGMSLEGILKEHKYKNNQYIDLYFYSILKKEWKTNLMKGGKL